MLVVNCVQCKIYSVGSRVSVYGLRIVTPDMILRSRRETSDVLRIVSPDKVLRSRRETKLMMRLEYSHRKRFCAVEERQTYDALRIVSPEKILRCRRETSVMGIPDSVIQPLQKIQNFAARLVLLAPRHHHSTPLLEKLHWLPISKRIKYKVACMCLSAISGSGPAYPSELLFVYTPSRTLRSSSDTRMLEIQQYKRKTHGFRTFSCFGPHIWNSLPHDLRHCSTLSSFKAKLKTFLFSQYFHPN